MTRPADCCGACGTQLQPLEPASTWATMADQLCASAGLRRPGPLALALVVHVAILHDAMTELPPLVPFDPKRNVQS